MVVQELLLHRFGIGTSQLSLFLEGTSQVRCDALSENLTSVQELLLHGFCAIYICGPAETDFEKHYS